MRRHGLDFRCDGRWIFSSSNLPIALAPESLRGARLVGSALIVSPLESKVPDAAEALKWELNSFLPNVHITDLLAEVDGWTGFADKFTHLRTGDMVRNRSAILAAVLADATNLGPKRMAEASSNVSERQISWAQFVSRPARAHRAAQAAIIDAHSAHPPATLWGAGATSSSDGQFFRASDRAHAARSDVNLHYGGEPGTKFYSHLSDQYGCSASCRSARARARGANLVVTLDGYRASHRAVKEALDEHPQGNQCKIRSSKYLNNLIEQDHRSIKLRLGPMLGLKHFRRAATTIAGIELIHRVRTGQVKLGKLRIKDKTAPKSGTLPVLA